MVRPLLEEAKEGVGGSETTAPLGKEKRQGVGPPNAWGKSGPHKVCNFRVCICRDCQTPSTTEAFIRFHRGLVTVDGVQVGGGRGEEHLHRPVEVVLVVQGLRSLLREVSGAILLLKY